jgi:hypothetical protein
MIREEIKEALKDGIKNHLQPEVAPVNGTGTAPNP